MKGISLGHFLRRTVSIGVILIVVVGGLAAWQKFQTKYLRPDGLNRVFFTVDDGQTYFADDLEQIPPYVHDGKTAVRADVFISGDGKTTFVGYLSRFNPETKIKLDNEKADAIQHGRGLGGLFMDTHLSQGTEVKRPGSGTWVPLNSPEGHNITTTSNRRQVMEVYAASGVH